MHIISQSRQFRIDAGKMSFNSELLIFAVPGQEKMFFFSVGCGRVFIYIYRGQDVYEFLRVALIELLLVEWGGEVQDVCVWTTF